MSIPLAAPWGRSTIDQDMYATPIAGPPRRPCGSTCSLLVTSATSGRMRRLVSPPSCAGGCLQISLVPRVGHVDGLPVSCDGFADTPTSARHDGSLALQSEVHGSSSPLAAPDRSGPSRGTHCSPCPGPGASVRQLARCRPSDYRHDVRHNRCFVRIRLHRHEDQVMDGLSRAELLDHELAEAMDKLVIVKSAIYTSGESAILAIRRRADPPVRCISWGTIRACRRCGRGQPCSIFSTTGSGRRRMLQSARLALKNGCNEKVILACLVHDCSAAGFIRAIARLWAAQLISGHVDEEVAFAVGLPSVGFPLSGRGLRLQISQLLCAASCVRITGPSLSTGRTSIAAITSGTRQRS